MQNLKIKSKKGLVQLKMEYDIDSWTEKGLHTSIFVASEILNVACMRERERGRERHILCKTCPHSSFCENSPSVQRDHIMKLSFQNGCDWKIVLQRTDGDVIWVVKPFFFF